MLIRRMRTEDIRKIVSLWYDVSLDAHDFISLEYWKKNKKMMERKYLPNSETYVAIEDDDIVGFISMKENILAALFVHTSFRWCRNID
jgi:putative acetyltransferase